MNDTKTELLELVDGVKVIVELWDGKSPAQAKWQADWLAKANRILKEAREPVEKKPAHTSCVGCEKFGKITGCAYGCILTNEERKNYTPAPAPAPKVTDAGPLEQSLLDTISQACDDAGRVPGQTIPKFIRHLAQRAGEGYSVEEIQYYLGRCYLSTKMGTLFDARTKINDPQDGIAAIVNRRKNEQ